MTPSHVEFDMQEHIPLAPLTTIGLGGEAKYFSSCTTAGEIRAAIDHARRRGLRVQILGGGSNLIFGDAGFDGLVVKIANRGIEWTDEGRTVLAAVEAGEVWDEFVQACVRQGYGGVECLCGIPGSVGATPVQNVGAYGQEVRDTIVSVTAIHRPTGEETVFSNTDCEFGYRDSRFKSREKDRWIVTRVGFRLIKNGAPAIVYPELRRHIEAASGSAGLGSSATKEEAASTLAFVRDAVIALRRKKSMVVDPSDPNTRSVGSFFMNPIVGPDVFALLKRQWEGLHPDAPVPFYPMQGPAGANVKIPAAWLIEQAGFARGYKGAGGVGISANHTLALVNDGGTTASLLAFARTIQDGVRSVFGISLDREAIVVD